MRPLSAFLSLAVLPRCIGKLLEHALLTSTVRLCDRRTERNTLQSGGGAEDGSC